MRINFKEMMQLQASREQVGTRREYKAIVDQSCSTCGKSLAQEIVHISCGERQLCADCFLIESPAPIRVADELVQHQLPYMGKRQ